MVRLVRKLLALLALPGLAFCWAGVVLTSDYDTKNCNVLVHVSEDNESLFLENIHIPGTYMTTSCWGTSATYCHVLDTSSYYKNEMKNIGTKTFTNKSGQLCYFRNFGLRTGNMSGFFYQPWSYVYDVAVSVDCEDSSSVPLYCAKSERMAKQVLLAREELKCGEKGGSFEGGVFPVKREGGATEYCVSASCDICGSKWYEDYINDWKTERCCENRKKEPNRNMGTCTNPGPMDSTRIGVKTSEVKAFPGCSDIDAGGRENGNFCSVPGSSSSSESSSSALSSSSEETSSSSEESSSSSEEQETANCYIDDDVADAMLTSREDECWSRQLLPNFKLDHFGCIVGDCEENGSSSSAGDENTGDDLQSSSSEEDGQCRDPSLMKERSNGLDDGWIYVGKEKYSSKIVSYEEAKPAKSGFFDALGRMYKRVKSKIKYYVGKETKVKKTVEVAEELDVWKKVEMIDGREIVSYKKINGIKSVAVDSVIYGDSLYSRSEINLSVNFSKSIDTLGIMRFASYDDNFDLKFVYYIGLPQDVVFDSSGNVNPCFSKVNGDTAFFDVSYSKMKQLSNEKKLSSLKKSSSVSWKYGDNLCPKWGQIKGEVICYRPFKDEVSEATCNYYPGKNDAYTYGKVNYHSLDKEFEPNFKPEKKGGYCVKNKDDGCLKYNAVYPEILLDYDVVVYASNWKYDRYYRSWKEYCWAETDMKKTYEHERMHVRNSRDAIYYFKKIFLTMHSENAIYTDLDECENDAKFWMSTFTDQYNQWDEREQMHFNEGVWNMEEKDYDIHPSPIPSDADRTPVKCD